MMELLSVVIKLLQIKTESNAVDIEEFEEFLYKLFSPTCDIKKLSSSNRAPSYVIEINGGKGNKGIVFAGHYDTVGSSGLNVIEDSDKIHGRGSVDMKYFIGCIWDLLPFLQSGNFDFPIYLCLSSDEEIDTSGVSSIVNHFKHEEYMKFELCIIGEPSNFVPCTKHNGYYALKLDVMANGGHSSCCFGESNAIHMAIKLVERIIHEKPCHQINITSFNSGQESENSNPHTASFVLELRPSSEEPIDDIISQVRIIADQMFEKKAVFISVNPGFIPCFKSKSSYYCNQIFDSCGGTFAAASEAPFYLDICDEVIIFGAGDISRAHSKNEYILKTELERYRNEIKTAVLKYKICKGTFVTDN